MFVETFLACFRHFYFLTQTEYFAWAIAFALWPFLPIFKMLLFFEYKLFFFKCSHFSTISCFIKPFFAYNNSKVFFERLLACFRHLYFLNQTEYSARAIAFALWPSLAIFNVLSFFEY